MSPLPVILALLALSISVAILEFLYRRRKQCAFRPLARQRQMHYSPRDQLRLAPRVAASLPLPGAAYVRVSNILYATSGSQRRYVFTVEYTIGVVRAKKRLRRVAAFSEPSDRNASPTACTLQMAPPQLPLIEQYRALLDSGL